MSSSLPELAQVLRSSTPGGRAVPDDLADRLVTAIAVGAYSPGERLPPERELARALGVSRTSLRAALQQVVDLGLVESRRGRSGGNFVATRRWEEVAPETARRVLERELPRLADLFDLRCMVEGMVARAAAERRTERDIGELTRALDDFAAATDMIEARAADLRLHGLVGSAAGNPLLLSLSAQLTAQATLGFGSEPYELDFYDRAAGDHRTLVESVIAGDAEAAGRCAEEHFTITADTMRSSLLRVAGAAPPRG